MSAPIFRLLSTLSDPLRTRILHVLVQGEFSVGELTQIFQTAQSTMSRHVKVLLQTQWVKKRIEGTASWLSFQPALLSEEDQALWRLLQSQTHPQAQSDIDKAKTLLSLRQTDSEHFFQTIKERWTALRTSLYGEHFLLPTLLSLLPSQYRVVDLGCGNGDTLKKLSPHVSELVGIDRSQAMLSIAKKQTTNCSNVQLKEGVLEQLPLEDNHFDAALCILVLHHVPDIATTLQEVARILKPSGTLTILDMEKHSKTELQNQMGHKHLGFKKIDLQHPSFRLLGWHPIPKEESALGPSLFVAHMQKI